MAALSCGFYRVTPAGFPRQAEGEYRSGGGNCRGENGEHKLNRRWTRMYRWRTEERRQIRYCRERTQRTQRWKLNRKQRRSRRRLTAKQRIMRTQESNGGVVGSGHLRTGTSANAIRPGTKPKPFNRTKHVEQVHRSL